MPRKRDNTYYYKSIQEYINAYLPFSEEEFQEIKKCFEFRQFAKKQQVLTMGQTEDYFSIVMKGVVRKYVLSGKKEVTTQLATEGDYILSEISFIKRDPSIVIIETIEPSVLISVKYEHLEQLYANMPKVEKLGRLIVTDMFLKKDSQDFINLDKTTRERFLDYVNTYPHMLQRVPQRYLASFLNIKPETFSRLKHLLRKRPE